VTGQARAKLLEMASRLLQAPAHALKMEVDEEIGQGVIYVDGVPGKRITVERPRPPRSIMGHD
jgi:hypothetical protein